MLGWSGLRCLVLPALLRCVSETRLPPLRPAQNPAQALICFVPASLATGPGPNFWTKTRIGVTRAAG